MLPIYGTGAVIILLATIPVRDSLWLVFLLGMLAATALEYVTGAAMEALFKVRYWDYSKQPFNLNGYICLTSSLAWGAFSILLVRFLHPPVEDLVLRLPAFLVDPLAFLLTIAVTVDAVRSFQAAMDLREVLTRLTEENEDLRRLAKRVGGDSALRRRTCAASGSARRWSGCSGRNAGRTPAARFRRPMPRAPDAARPSWRSPCAAGPMLS